MSSGSHGHSIHLIIHSLLYRVGVIINDDAGGAQRRNAGGRVNLRALMFSDCFQIKQLICTY